MITARRLRRSNLAIAALIASVAIAIGARVSAHRLDEYLQAARIAVARERMSLDLSLTPGAAVAGRVITDIDADRNGNLSRQEQRAYAAQVLEALLVSVDGAAPIRLQLLASTFPEVVSLRSGDGAITIRAAARVSRLAAGPHHLLFRNHHAAGMSVYLANALVPDHDDVAVTGQERTGDQSELTINFIVRDVPNHDRKDSTGVTFNALRAGK